MRRVALVLFIAVAVLAATPAAATETTLAALSIRSAKVTQTGAVRISARYICPTGYSYDPNRELDNSGYVTQFGRDSRLRGFGQQLTCDGTIGHIILRIARTRSGEPFDPDTPFLVNLAMMVYSGDDSVAASTQETWSSGTAIGELRIRDVSFQATGSVRVTAGYMCPAGAVPIFSSTQLFQPGVGSQRKQFASRLVCDGTRNVVSVTFRTTEEGAAFQADTLTYVQLGFAAEVSRTFAVQAYDVRSVLIEA